MRHTVAAILTMTAFATAAAGAGPTLYQHGGRATGQAGASTARAVSAAAMAYNPAAIARLPGGQATAGIDFTAPFAGWSSATAESEADHIITFFPAVYVSWHLPDDRVPFAFGMGIDAKSWHFMDWDNALFPGRFENRRTETTIYDAHPVVAYQLDERWSVGGGIHYYFGTLGLGRNGYVFASGSAGDVQIEVERLAEADADGWAVDLGLHYDAEVWGWGLALDSGGEIEGTGEVTYDPRDVPNDPVLSDNLDLLLADGRSRQSFELPWEARTGFWMAPVPSLRLVLDLAWTGWSVVDATELAIAPDPFRRTATTTETTRRDWDDTISLRGGVEWDLSPRWMLSGGIGWEPSPVPDETLEPGFPTGDAMVYAVGFGYHLPNVAFDLGYSFHQIDDREVTGLEPGRPNATSTFEARQQVWAVSASWRW